MTAKLAHSGSSPSPEAGFDVVADVIRAEARAISEQSSETRHTLTVAENAQLFRVASQGILGILRDEGLEEADSLMEELEKEAAGNQYADLVAVSATYYDESRKSDDSAVQHEKEELSRLARVVGDASHAAVVVAMGQAQGQDVNPVLFSVRQGLIDYDNHEGSIAGDTLHAFLDEAEAAVPAPAEEPHLAA